MPGETRTKISVSYIGRKRLCLTGHLTRGSSTQSLLYRWNAIYVFTCHLLLFAEFLGRRVAQFFFLSQSQCSGEGTELLSVLGPQSHCGDKIVLIINSLYPKRDCGTKRVNVVGTPRETKTMVDNSWC